MLGNEYETEDTRCQWCEEMVENLIECVEFDDLTGLGLCFGSSGDFSGVEFLPAIV